MTELMFLTVTGIRIVINDIFNVSYRDRHYDRNDYKIGIC
jgi:hypothetical protein